MLEPWLAGHEQPTGETLALRSGKAGDRIRRLFAFMSTRIAQGRRSARLTLPHLKDIAEITNL